MNNFTSPEVVSLARRIVALEREQLARKTPQLASSSIEDGGIDEYDGDGLLSSRVGAQFDYTHTVVSFSGPKPPTPTEAAVTPGQLSLTVRWNGLFAGGALSPMDLKHVEVELSTDGVGWSTQATIRGELGDQTILSPLPEQGHYVRLVARSLSGKASEPSTVAEATPLPVSDTAARGKVTVSDVAPTLADGDGKPINATWSLVDAAGAQIGFYRWDGAAWVDMPLAETIIPSINLGTGIYGELDGVYLSANAIDGKIITGAIYQTDAAANTGLKINDAGNNSLELFNPSGVRTLHADGDTGDVDIAGNFQTNIDGERVEITGRNTGTSGIAAVDMFADTTAQHGALYAFLPAGGAYRTVLAHYTDEFNMAGSLTLFEDGGFELSGDSTSVAAIWSDGFNNLNVRAADIRFLSRTEFSDNLVVNAGWSGAEVLAAFSDANFPDGAVRSPSIYALTTSGANNVHVTSGGYIRRSTSLEAAKINIDREWAGTESWKGIKQARPTTYYDRGNTERYAELASGEDVEDASYPTQMLGLIAEDVAALNLPQLNTYNDYGNLNGVAYERGWLPLLPWEHEQDTRLDRVEEALIRHGILTPLGEE